MRTPQIMPDLMQSANLWGIAFFDLAGRTALNGRFGCVASDEPTHQGPEGQPGELGRL